MSITSTPAGGEGCQNSLRQGSPHSRREAPPQGGSRPASVKLSLDTLRLGESFDTIKLDVGLLAWHIGHFPTENDTKMAEKVSEDDLYAILELSQNIGTNVDRIFSLRNQRRDATDAGSNLEDANSDSCENQLCTFSRPDVMGQESCDATRSSLRISTKRPRSPSCRTCSTDHTPKWRNGPAGPGTLCNGQGSGKSFEATFLMLIGLDVMVECDVAGEGRDL
ncbi:hypothetical protein E4U42_004239 [Claviceps africana]|uniref:GATA-type domain-containing protein n=1 Tax=Claviceps africana TaxID=83212 RepID=A0A8K0J5P3_9HYPO|nr:hypothetical protein E4U42_004239 [Claviceps africana]